MPALPWRLARQCTHGRAASSRCSLAFSRVRSARRRLGCPPEGTPTPPCRSAAISLDRLFPPTLPQELEKISRLRFSGTPPQECFRRFDDADLFGNRHSDELIERDAIGLRQPRRHGLDRRRQLQRIGAPTHRFNFFSRSRGSITRNPKRRAAGSKSRTLCVTRASACPLTAASNTSSSFGSLSWGRHRKFTSTASAALANAARKPSTACSL